MFIDEKCSIFKMAVLPKLICGFNTIPSIFQLASLKKLINLNLVLKSAQKLNRPRTAIAILKKNKVGRLTFPNFKTYYKGK